MKLYDIKHNGYTFGQKRGKKETVKALQRHLEFEGQLIACTWTDKMGVIEVIHKSTYDVYTIEESRG